jgi:hypothetical protein
MQQALLATARTFTLGVEEEAHSSEDQPINLDHTYRGSARRELRQHTNLLPCCRGPLPSRPGSKGVAPTDTGLFTLEQGELLSKRQSQGLDHAGLPAATSTHMQQQLRHEQLRGKGKTWGKPTNTEVQGS